MRYRTAEQELLNTQQLKASLSSEMLPPKTEIDQQNASRLECAHSDLSDPKHIAFSVKVNSRLKEC